MSEFENTIVRVSDPVDEPIVKVETPRQIKKESKSKAKAVGNAKIRLALVHEDQEK